MKVADDDVDGPRLLFLHQKRGSNLEATREPRGWYDWDEYR